MPKANITPTDIVAMAIADGLEVASVEPERASVEG